MKKFILSFIVICLSSFVLTGCNYPNQTPDEYVNDTVDPGLQEMVE